MSDPKEVLYYECRKTICERRCGGRVGPGQYDTIKVPLEELKCPKCGVGTWFDMVPVYKDTEIVESAIALAHIHLDNLKSGESHADRRMLEYEKLSHLIVAVRIYEEEGE